MKNISRRTAIKTVLAGSAAMAVSGMEAAAPAKKKKVEKPEKLRAESAFNRTVNAGKYLLEVIMKNEVSQIKTLRN